MRIGFDANFFKKVIDELVAGTFGTADEAVEKAFRVGVVVADEQELIFQEWRDCTGAASNEFASQWISDRLAEDRIVLFPTTGCHICRSAVIQRGLARADAKRLSIYKDINADFLISDDIDYFEPKQKKTATPRQRYVLMHERRGSLCR